MSEASGGRQARLLQLAPLLLFIVCAASWLWSSVFIRTGFPLDDAWIHRVYAKAFAFGQGFAYNPGQQEAGSTSPLWTVLTAPAHWLSLLGESAVALAVKAIGIGCGLWALFETQRLGRTLGLSLGASVLAACLLALEPRLLFAALAGMEVILVVALWLAAARALLERRTLAACLWLGLLPTARPEAILITLAGIGFLAVEAITRRKEDPKPSTRRSVLGLACLTVPTLLWVLFCLYANGRPLPTTFYVKAGSFDFGFESFQNTFLTLTHYGWLKGPLALLALLAFAALAMRRRSSPPLVLRYPVIGQALRLALLVVTPLGFALGVVASRHFVLTGYYWERWTDPAALVLCAGFSIGLAALLLYPAGTKIRAAAVVAGFVVLITSLPAVSSGFLERRARLESDSRSVHIMNVQPGQWLAANSKPGDTVGVSDAGAIRYWSGLPAIDLIGLNTQGIAFGTFDRRRFQSEPTFLAVFPRRVANNRRYQSLMLPTEQFEPRIKIEIPFEEYTVCPCPDQTLLVVSERKR